MDTLLPLHYYALLLFHINQPVGNHACILTMTKGMDNEERRHIVKRATIISFITLLAFTFPGNFYSNSLEYRPMAFVLLPVLLF